MSFTDVIKKSVLEGFQNGDISTTKVVIVLGMTLLLSTYIFFVYKLVNKTTLYDKEYHISMAVISVVTAGIIVAMQSNIVISLGMVGALSIVRFRTAIKSPMDLLFLFWSIGTGIICGAGLFETAILVCLMVTLAIFFFGMLPGESQRYLLILHADNDLEEEKLEETLASMTKFHKLKSRNVKMSGIDLMYEIKTPGEKEFADALKKVEHITHFSLMKKDGEVRV